MNKDQLLIEIKKGLGQGLITQNDLEEISSRNSKDYQVKSEIKIRKIFYIIGIVILIIALGSLIENIWATLGSLGRIFITLGLGIILNIVTLFLVKEKRLKLSANVVYLVSAFLIFSGIYVTLYELSTGSHNHWIPAALFLFLALVYAILSMLYRKIGHSVFALISVAAFSLSAFHSLLAINPSLPDAKFYLMLILSLIYIILAFKAQGKLHNYFSFILYFLGFFGVYYFFVYKIDNSLHMINWEIATYFFIALSFYLVNFIKSKLILVLSVFFLVAQIFRTTNLHFVNSLGWPLILFLLGCIFIALGFFSFKFYSKLN